MEQLEDNPDEEYYRFMQGLNKSKQEKEKIKQLTYLAPHERQALSNQVLPMQDNIEMDGYGNAGQGDEMAYAIGNRENLHYAENNQEQVD